MPKVATFAKACEYLDNFVRPLEKVSHTSVNPFERMKYLLSLLENPQNKFPSIVVSGTSGKGSTTYMITSILTKAGYKAGMTVSPHIETITERLQVNGKQISEKEFVVLLQLVIPAIEQMRTSTYGDPSYFEIILAMVFLYFAKEKVDIAIVEVGIEGKFDGTNVLNPLVFVLTNISLDHTNILGETVEEIAKEATERIKQYQVLSIKYQGVVVSGVTQKSVIGIVQERCKEAGVELFLLHKDFDYKIIKENVGVMVFDYCSSEASAKLKTGWKQERFPTSSNNNIFNGISLSLTGSYQAENASLAIETILQLQQFGFTVSEKNIREGLQVVKIPGRFEIKEFRVQSFDSAQDRSLKFKVILDGAHNSAKMNAFLGSLKKIYSDNQSKIFVIAFSKGHEAGKMLEQIANVADVLIITNYETTTDMGKNRGEEISNIKFQISNLKNARVREILVAKNPKEALSRAGGLLPSVVRSAGGEERSGLLIVTGSLYLVGEIRKLLMDLLLSKQIA